MGVRCAHWAEAGGGGGGLAGGVRFGGFKQLGQTCLLRAPSSPSNREIHR